MNMNYLVIWHKILSIKPFHGVHVFIMRSKHSHIVDKVWFDDIAYSYVFFFVWSRDNG